MTGTPTGSNGNGSDAPVDRRWFEEALRAQGFVVEPPPVEGPDPTVSAAGPVAPAPPSTLPHAWPDHGAEPVRLATPSVPTAVESPSTTTGGIRAPATLPDDRPPTPSGAFAARIAAAGRARPLAAPTADARSSTGIASPAAEAATRPTPTPAPALFPPTISGPEDTAAGTSTPVDRPDAGRTPWPESDTLRAQGAGTPVESAPPAASGGEAVTPWTNAVAAPVAPWAGSPLPTEPVVVTPASPEPVIPAAPGGPLLGSQPDTAVTSAEGPEHVVPGPSEARDTPRPAVLVVAAGSAAAGSELADAPKPPDGPEPPHASVVEVDATPAEAEGQAQAATAPDPGLGAPEPSPAALGRPYAPASGSVGLGVGSRPPATQPTEPESSEGELWALVGATVSPTTPQASMSRVTTVILTVLVALLVLVVVVGCLVLLSQVL